MTRDELERLLAETLYSRLHPELTWGANGAHAEYALELARAQLSALDEAGYTIIKLGPGESWMRVQAEKGNSAMADSIARTIEGEFVPDQPGAAGRVDR